MVNFWTYNKIVILIEEVKGSVRVSVTTDLSYVKKKPYS